jgi:hypothetical protein
MALISYSPLFASIVQRDSGVFSYIGWRILNGQVPYRDIWDHKPPLIYYINALGQWITPQSQWGVWMLQCLCLFAAAYMGYQIVKKLSGSRAAVLTLFTLLLTTNLLMPGGNLAEVYALPLQFLCIWILFKENISLTNIQCLLLGSLFALLFFLKQTFIGITLSIILFLFINRIQKRSFNQFVKEILFIFSGFVSISILFCLILSLQGALPDFWNDVFVFNHAYAQHDLLKGLFLTLLSLVYLLVTGLLIFAGFGYRSAIQTIKKDDQISSFISVVLFICLLDAPIEFIIAGLSGKAYMHYFIPMLPSMTILAGMGFKQIDCWISKKNGIKVPEYLFTIFCIVVIFLGNVNTCFLNVISLNDSKDQALLAEIKKYSAAQDSVLIFGNEIAFNYMAGRVSPSKYIYTNPLTQKGYATPILIDIYLNDILSGRPKLIILPGSEKQFVMQFPIHNEEIDQLTNKIAAQYQYLESTGNWSLFSRRD